jgi:hypothetical protein
VVESALFGTSQTRPRSNTCVGTALALFTGMQTHPAPPNAPQVGLDTRPTRPVGRSAERRTSPRVCVQIAARMLVDGMMPVACMAKDLSASGALLVGPAGLAPGTAVRVTLPVGVHSLTVWAKVVRLHEDERGETGLAVRFVDVHPRVQDLIQTYVLARLRRGATTKKREPKP